MMAGSEGWIDCLCNEDRVEGGRRGITMTLGEEGSLACVPIALC